MDCSDDDGEFVIANNEEDNIYVKAAFPIGNIDNISKAQVKEIGIKECAEKIINFNDDVKYFTFNNDGRDDFNKKYDCWMYKDCKTFSQIPHSGYSIYKIDNKCNFNHECLSNKCLNGYCCKNDVLINTDKCDSCDKDGKCNKCNNCNYNLGDKCYNDFECESGVCRGNVCCKSNVNQFVTQCQSNIDFIDNSTIGEPNKCLEGRTKWSNDNLHCEIE